MPTGCCGSKPAASGAACRRCGERGLPVPLQTVKALLGARALARLQPSAYRFCAQPECRVVYFDESGGTFQVEDIRVTVWHKEPTGDRPICYCFGDTEETIRGELRRAGVSAAVDRIRQHIAADRCACDVRNPRGVCCLGDVTAAVARVRATLEQSEEALKEKVRCD